MLFQKRISGKDLVTGGKVKQFFELKVRKEF